MAKKGPNRETIYDQQIVSGLIYHSISLDEIAKKVYRNNPKFHQYKEKNKVKCLVMPTGTGKTYNYWNHLVPILLDSGVKVFLYVAPRTELLEQRVARIAIKKMIKSGYLRDKDTQLLSTNDFDDLDHLKEKIDSCEITFIMATDQYFGSDLASDISGARLEAFASHFQTLGDSFTSERDEIHIGGASDAESAENKNGVYNKHYQAQYDKFQSMILETTPHVYCQTATPFEELQANSDFGHDNWVIITEGENRDKLVKATDVVAYQSHMETPRYHRLGVADKKEIIKLINHELEDLIRCKERVQEKLLPYMQTNGQSALYGMTGLMNTSLNIKRCAMIRVKRGKKGAVDMKFMVEEILPKSMPDGMEYVATFSQISASDRQLWREIPGKRYAQRVSGYQVYDSNGNPTERYGKGNEYLDYLRDVKDPCQAIVVVDKGTVGIDIDNFKTLIAFTSSNAKNESGYILDSQIQLIGRLQRGYLGGLTPEQVSEMPEGIQCILYEELNRFNIIVPNHQSWKETITRWKESDGVMTDDLWKFRNKI